MTWVIVGFVIVIAFVAFATFSRESSVSSVQTTDRKTPQGFLQRSHRRILEAQDIIDRTKSDIQAGTLDQERLETVRDRLFKLYAEQIHEPRLDSTALQQPDIRYWLARIGDRPLDAVAPDMLSLEYMHTRYGMFLSDAHLWIQELHAKNSSSVPLAPDSEVVGSLSTELAELDAYARAIKATRP